jgi:hypothetical protein
MTPSLNDIIYAGGTGALSPAHYTTVAGYGTCTQDLTQEEPQPRGWRWGTPPSWHDAWLPPHG